MMKKKKKKKASTEYCPKLQKLIRLTDQNHLRFVISNG